MSCRDCACQDAPERAASARIGFAVVAQEAGGRRISTDEEHPLDDAQAGVTLLRGGGARVGAYAVGSVLSIVGLAFVTRSLNPAGFGALQTVLNIGILVATITDLGLASLGIREYTQREPRERDAFLRSLFALRLILSLVGSIVVVAVTALRGYDESIVLGAIGVGLGNILFASQITLSIPLYATMRLVAVSLLDLLRQAALALLYVALALVGASVLWFLWMNAVSAAVVAVATLLVVRGAAVAWPRFRYREMRALVGVSVAFALAIAASTTYQFGIQIVTSFVAPDDVTGWFSVAQRAFVVICAVPGLLITSAFALLTRTHAVDIARFRRVVARLTHGSAFVGVALGVGVVVGAPFLIAVAGGAQYDEAVMPLHILGGALALASVAMAWSAALLAAHAHRTLIVANLTVFATGACLTVLLIGPLGASGPAIATLVGESLMALSYGALLMRRGWFGTSELWAALRIVVAGVVAAAVGLLLPVGSLIGAMIALGVFGALAILLRVVPTELGEMLPGSIRRIARI